MIVLEAGDVVATVSPSDGGRIAQITVGGTDLLIDAADGDALRWGSYPMVPWAGRLRDGRFTFDGTSYAVPANLGPHAIHGTAFTAPWEVLDVGVDHVELGCPLTWALGGTAHQHLQLGPDGLVCVLSAMAGGQAMPATLGWHPWFVKPVHDRLSFDSMYLRDDDYVPTGLLVTPPERPWDDCFVGAHHPLQLDVPGNGGSVRVTVSSDCDHWVVYDQPEHATCVEPQSGPPDAFNIGGATRLEPGEMLQRTMTLRWMRPAG
jgi:aldose 1-epimerase